MIPDTHFYCACGHQVGSHRGGSVRPCMEITCACEGYERVPRAKCTTCGHVGALHGPRRGSGALWCTATGCQCPEWQEAPSGLTTITVTVTVPQGLTPSVAVCIEQQCSR